ncbi:MAG: type II secretion system F family protein [Planctomycetes bacterium]|nr:type II secretion system F family protein [Planctomycetota bacterium]NOG54409.1 type II secretion system F family protein [Planctomycetota bacterium]
MATEYEYIARDAAGRKVEGRLMGASAQSVAGELASSELSPVSIQPRSQRATSHGERRISARALSTFYRQLGDLLKSGVPILRALRLLARGKANRRLAGVVSQVAQDVEDGESLADALSRHSRMFPPIQVAMVRAGERGGFLEEVLHRLAIFLHQQAETRSMIISSMIYPSVLISVGTIIVGIVMFVFVPKFKPMFEGIDLPLPTRIVMGASDIIRFHWLPAGLAAMAVIGGLMWLWAQPGVRHALARGVLRLWIVGPLVAGAAVARFCRILGTMLTNGIPMLEAMAISQEAVGHPMLVEAIEKSRRAVQAGETLADPLEECGLFEEDVVEIIRIGEAAGNLAEVLVSIAETIEGRVSRMLMTAVRLLEPLVLLLLGISLLFIILALVVPLVLLSSTV